MRIIVCAKQVPDTTEVRIDPVTSTLIRDGVPSILNPDDKNALEAALAIKDANPGTTVSVISMGPPQAMTMLRECLAMGADGAYLLSDRAFGGADTLSTSATIAAGIRQIGEFDLVICGRQAIDGDTAQVGPQIGTRLGLPVVTYVTDLKYRDGAVTLKRELEEGTQTIEVKLPCLLTVVGELNEPRYMTVRGIEEACAKDITVWNHLNVGLDPSDCGLNASPTQVIRSVTPPRPTKGCMLDGSPAEAAGKLIEKLRELQMI